MEVAGSMLLSKEVSEMAADLRDEAAGRPYVALLVPEVAADENFWKMLVELFEIVIHRRGYVLCAAPEAITLPDELRQTP
jgi:hypothetical protein